MLLAGERTYHRIGYSSLLETRSLPRAKSRALGKDLLCRGPPTEALGKEKPSAKTIEFFTFFAEMSGFWTSDVATYSKTIEFFYHSLPMCQYETSSSFVIFRPRIDLI